MTVYLVGAGPGAFDLLTIRAAELLRRADVVVYDRLVAGEVLELVPETAIKVDVGKSPGQSDFQNDINEKLIAFGRTHEVVVRLKGGDPFVFGRGGEEALVLKDAGIKCEVVPGVTSALGVPAIAGVPVTHRGLSTSFTVVTGHRQHGEPDVDWNALGKAGGTIVVLMGVTRRADIARSLIDAGRSPEEPVAVVQRGTRDDEQRLITTLGGLGAVEVKPPAVIVIGLVASLELFGG